MPDLSPQVCGALRKYGRRSEPRAGEDLGAFESRLQTDLMVLFRETGSHAVFDAIYQRTREDLAAWVSYLLRTRGLCMDPGELVQDTFVNIYSYAGTFREGRGHSFLGWARTIAANATRRARRRGRTVPLSDAFDFEDSGEGPSSAAEAWEEVALMREGWAVFLMVYLEAFHALSPRDQRALGLIEVEGVGYDVAAKKLGVGRSNVKMIVFRSRKRLQGHMRRWLNRGGSVGEQGVRRVG